MKYMQYMISFENTILNTLPTGSTQSARVVNFVGKSNFFSSFLVHEKISNKKNKEPKAKKQVLLTIFFILK